ncbi:ATP-binding protein [Nonlabens sp.]|uniref:ATP-binding protein n=1 Tax=Nonlabens sp. TaxID=1888209 RepID=UPI0032650CBE
MGNNLYGNGFIEKLVNSGYKSPIYAMAEIIDNSVDAGAKNIDITFVEDDLRVGGRGSKFISDVFFIDNGSGMNFEQINGCLKFAEGAGTSNKRIGTFGVGLPNSSIYVGRRVEVYSKDTQTNKWNYVCLDLDEQANRDEPGYDDAFSKEPKFKNISLKLNLNEAMTIIRWSKIKNLGSRRPKTVIDKTKKLTGRLYRYALQDNLKITFGSILKGNNNYDIFENVLPYDPLFLATSKTYITEFIWDAATNPNKNVFNQNVENNERFTSSYHYKKYTKGCIKNETNLPLFQKYDNYWNVKYEVNLDSKIYHFIIRASFSTKSAAYPGIRKGGGTSLGRKIGEKMSGSKDFTSGNIFFIRTKREIDCGHFGMYTVTDETNRWWTIEIEFDSELDSLMGVDYQKQHVDFKPVLNAEVDEIRDSSNLELNEKQQILFNRITNEITNCIKDMRGFRREFWNQYKNEEKEAIALASEDEDANPLPVVEPAVIRAMPQGNEWTDDQKEDLVNFLKSRFMHLSKEAITFQVDNFAAGMNKTIVLYHSNPTGNLFELTTIRGKKITFINTEHIYYKNIIDPLKQNKNLSVFTVAIEMLICSYAYEMEQMIQDDNKLEFILNSYLRKISDRLESFIKNGSIQVDTEYWEENISNDDDDGEVIN